MPDLIIEKLHIDRPFQGLSPLIQQVLFGLILLFIAFEFMPKGIFSLFVYIIGYILTVDVVVNIIRGWRE